MSEDVAAQCSNCRFWFNDGYDTGECRRHAPPVLKLGYDHSYRMEDRAHWPNTHGGEWCGDYEPDVLHMGGP